MNAYGRRRIAPISFVLCSFRPLRPLRRSALLAAIVGIALITGCASSTDTSTHAQSDGKSDSAGTVALAYTYDMFEHRLAAAARLTTPSDRHALTYLAKPLASRNTSAHNLAAGSTTTIGNTAEVVIIGTLCSAPKSGPAPATPCGTNADTHSTNPGFQVRLRRSSGGSWQVDFPAPSTIGSGAATSYSTPLPATSSSSAS
jgi:hypothetical protein